MMTLFTLLIWSFELALHTLLKKSALNKAETQEKQSSSLETAAANHNDLSESKGKNITDACCTRNSEADMGHVSLNMLYG